MYKTQGCHHIVKKLCSLVCCYSTKISGLSTRKLTKYLAGIKFCDLGPNYVLQYSLLTTNWSPERYKSFYNQNSKEMLSSHHPGNFVEHFQT
jgi:hypothetical protein